MAQTLSFEEHGQKRFVHALFWFAQTLIRFTRCCRLMQNQSILINESWWAQFFLKLLVSLKYNLYKTLLEKNLESKQI